MIIDSQNLIVSVKCRRNGDYKRSKMNECRITMGIRNIFKTPKNTGSERKNSTLGKSYTASHFVAFGTTFLNRYGAKHIQRGIKRMGALA